MQSVSTVVIIAAVVLAVILLVKILSKHIKKIFKFVFNTAMGFVLLWLVNFFGDWIGLYIEPNLLNCVVVGFLGIPGVILLILMHYVL